MEGTTELEGSDGLAVAGGIDVEERFDVVVVGRVCAKVTGGSEEPRVLDRTELVLILSGDVDVGCGL